MQIRVPPGTHNYVNELLAYPSLYGRIISDFIILGQNGVAHSLYRRCEVHYARVKGHKVEEAYCNVFILACICVHPIDQTKTLNLMDTMNQ